MKLIDNINHLLGDDLKHTLQTGSRLKIAASCFSMYAFEALQNELKAIEELQFIFTAPTFVADAVTDKIRKEQREFHIPKNQRERGVYGSEFEIQLRNKLTQRAIARECAQWMRDKVTFKSNRSAAPMQSFACVHNADDAAVYTPLNGFTAVDLGYQQGNAVSNLVHKLDDVPFTETYLNLFNQIWHDADKLEDVSAQVIEYIASVYQENSPQYLYFLMLYTIFSDFLDEMDDDVLPNDKTGYQDTLIWNKLFHFQKDAATGIINKLESFNGCILAASVGLGKTFTALAVIKYYELRNRSVLVLCPKKLADNWLNYNRNLTTNIFARDRFNYDVLCHTDLSRTRGESFGMQLNRINWGNYDLVVIDESHNFRNNDAYKDKETRYQKLMNQVIKQGVKTKVLMLSATPVNNRFNDLRNQLALAYEGTSEHLSAKLKTEKSIESIFVHAQASFNTWAKLPAEQRTARAILDALDFDFFELLDSVTIARSRKHIQTFYDTSEIGSFPERLKPLSFHSPLTQRSDVMGFNDIYAQLSMLKLALYAPITYVLPSRLKNYEALYDTQVSGQTRFRQADREKSLQALMTTNLLKRLESSVASFCLTLHALRTKMAGTLDQIAAFHLSQTDTMTVDDVALDDDAAQWDDEDTPVWPEHEIGGKVKIKLADMDVDSWAHELRSDLVLIDELLASMAKVTPEHDYKLQHLKNLIQGKINAPINAGNRKILIFTAFADTADYLYQHIAPELLAQHSLHSAKVTGSSAPKSTLSKSYDFQELLTLFSPQSKEKAQTLPHEAFEIDLLIGTDCISEGQNLQDCDYLINYDIHWNPVRIIQRFGRIDRIGSTNAAIQLVNYWPDISLDEYINLKDRVESRMMIADVTATGDDNILSAKANDVSYRKEQLQRMQEEVIDLEDVKTGISITDLGLNDFRMDLLNHVKQHGELNRAPSGMHAVVHAQPELGLHSGVIFTLRNITARVDVNQHNRLHPYYLVYISHAGEVIHDHTQVKRLLDLARAACKTQTTPNIAACTAFNQATDDGRNMRVYSDLLNGAIASMVAVNDEKDIDSLFSGGKTSALTQNMEGLDDFELIAFLVIQ
jgi:hypothetical protein